MDNLNAPNISKEIEGVEYTLSQLLNEPNEYLNKEPALTDAQDELILVKFRIKNLQKVIILSQTRWELATSRLFYFVGEVALKFLTYLEVVFTREIKNTLQIVS